jgi:hypothetical protein
VTTPFIGVDALPFVGSSSTRRGRGRRTISLGLGGTLSHGVHGIAASAGVNVLTGESRGALLAAGLNWSHGAMVGVQLSGGANVNVGNMHGLQAAAGANITIGAMSGLQATAGVNYARGGRGLQLGSLNIQRGSFDGVQVGLVNVSDDATFSLGLVNVVRKGRTHLEATVSGDGFANLMLKHGGERYHWIYGFGGRPDYDDDDDADGRRGAFALGWGLGAHFPVTERFSLDLDGVLHYLLDGPARHPNVNGLEFLTQVRLVANVALHRRFALVFGASANLHTAWGTSDTYAPWAVTLRGEEALTDQIWRAHFWPSVFVGVRAF